jgi:hypothetical protein
MKPLFILISFLFLFFPSYGQQFDYQRSWSTYYLGANTIVSSVAKDSYQNSIVVGSVNPIISNTSPIQYEPSSYYDQWATTGAYQPIFLTNGVSYDGYITKFSPEGAVVWSTYFGGINSDGVLDVATDSQDNIYIVGFTNSDSSIATNDSFISNFSTITSSSVSTNNKQGFLAKFSSAGTLSWSTYLPLSPILNSTSNIYVAVSSANEIFVYGNTIAANASLITTLGAFKETFYTYPVVNPLYENINGYILKFDAQGNRLAGTFCGSAITPTDIATDSEGNIIIVGAQDTETNAEILSSPNSYQQNPNALGDGFISKFSNDLTTRIWSTYYGDLVSDKLNLVTTSGTDIFVHGRTMTLGSGIMATAGTYSQALSDGYLAKFTGAGTRVWGTYLPFIPIAAITNSVYSMVVNNNNLYIAGSTRETTGISTQGAYQSNFASTDALVSDGFMMQFTTNGVRNWGSYYGGERGDVIKSIIIDSDGTFYICGITKSSTNISTPTSNQPNINYGSTIVTSTTNDYNVPNNMFLAKFSNPLSVPTVSNNLVKLAPNPSDGQFTLSGNWHTGYNNLKLQLYDSLGKEVAQKEIAPFQEELHQGFDFRGLPQGIYFAKLTAGAEVLQTVKLLIK